jgi:hypothetical protein
MKNITEDTIVVHYDEVSLEISYELYEGENHRRIVFNTKPFGLAEQAILNAIEEHLKMKKDGRLKVFELNKGGE